MLGLALPGMRHGGRERHTRVGTYLQGGGAGREEGVLPHGRRVLALQQDIGGPVRALRDQGRDREDRRFHLRDGC